MKQEIIRWNNGNISYIINRNNSGRLYGLCVRYKLDGSILYIDNWFNGKRFGLDTEYNIINTQKYHL